MDSMPTPPNILVLSRQSLLSCGVASTLREHQGEFNVQVLNSEDTDILKMIQAESPSVIIMDGGDTVLSSETSASHILDLAPNAKVVQLDLSSDRIRVFASFEMTVQRGVDLIHVLQKLSQLGAVI